MRPGSPGNLTSSILTENCPVLDAAFNEVLRHNNTGGAMRKIIGKARVGDKRLQPRNMAYIPFHQVHTNENVWGDRCLESDYTRFLKR